VTIVYLDCETTGLDPTVHEPWEIAYAVDDGPIHSTFLPLHRFGAANPDALRVGGFHDRYKNPGDMYDVNVFDEQMREALNGATLTGANPSFDAGMLQHALWASRHHEPPWHYRMLDVEVYAMGALGYDVPKGLNRITADLQDRGHDIPIPDHTAAGDVATVRACHLALIAEYR
jgi:hypothetical protein